MADERVSGNYVAENRRDLMPSRTFQTLRNIIRSATYGEKGVETDLWELELTPTRKRAGKCTRP